MGGNVAAQRALLKERLLVAYDLTAALGYMHEHRLLYRDVKPENVGFDIRGDVKVFDFGLMKSMDDNLKAARGRYGYKLTAVTGSVPYMAPEIALGEPYGAEADVFSFTMLLWEMLSSQFLDYTMKTYFVRLVRLDERPPIGEGGTTSWPAVLRNVVSEGWHRQPTKRPPMKRVGMLIRGLLQDMSEGDRAVTNRTQHMLNRSRRSFHHGMSASSGGGIGGIGGIGDGSSNGGGARRISLHNNHAVDLKALTEEGP